MFEKELYKHLTWDSNFFGFKVAQIDLNILKEQESVHLFHELESNRYKLVYGFADPDNEKSNAIARLYNGLLVDEKVTYNLNISETILNMPEKIIKYEKNKPDKQLIHLALESGHHSRFMKDIRIREFYNKMYTAWIENSVNKKMADELMVYINMNEIAGFITIKFYNRYAQIGLLAVDEKYRGMQIGSELIASAKYLCCKNGLNKLKVVTQKANKGACRFYEKNGFEIIKTENIYHFWF